MNKHCKGCTRHHNAGHPKDSQKGLMKFNDWCRAHGYPAKDSIGWCKLTNAKRTSNDS